MAGSAAATPAPSLERAPKLRLWHSCRVVGIDEIWARSERHAGRTFRTINAIGSENATIAQCPLIAPCRVADRGAGTPPAPQVVAPFPAETAPFQAPSCHGPGRRRQGDQGREGRELHQDEDARQPKMTSG